MIPKWQNRPIIVANLYNPAFCGEVLRVAIKSYEKEKNEGLPFALTFLFLPFLLYSETNRSIPSKVSKNFYEWLEENPKIKIFIGEQVKNLVPYTREAIQFLIYYESITINDQAELKIISYRKKSINYKNDDEINEIYKKAEILGKWFARTGEIKTIYALLGIRP